jgi:hypothetical protein
MLQNQSEGIPGALAQGYGSTTCVADCPHKKAGSDASSLFFFYHELWDNPMPTRCSRFEMTTYIVHITEGTQGNHIDFHCTGSDVSKT